MPVNDPIAMAAGLEQAIDFPISESLLRDAVKPFAEQEVIQKHLEALGVGIRK